MSYASVLVALSLWRNTFSNKDIILLGSVLLNIVFIVIFYIKYYYNITPFLSLSIKRFKKDFPEFEIKVRNIGKIPFEIEPPVVIFKKKGAKRLFQVRTGTTQFPLALFRKNEYDFIIDLAKFYTTDNTLITYTQVHLEIRDKNQKSLAKKRIRIK
jgi:hypothetical protein